MQWLYQIVLRALYWINSEPLYKLVRRCSAPRLKKLLIHITDQCNYDCVYCYVDKKNGTLSFPEWTAILEQAKTLGVTKVSILGGEPLCAPYLPELLRKITQLRMKPYLYTNGALLDESWMNRLLPFKPVLIFKYDSDNATYQRYTRQQAVRLADIEQTIQRCRRAGFTVMTFTALTRDNADHVEAIFSRSVQLGALPAFERYLPVRDAQTNEQLELSDAAYRDAMKKVARKLKHLIPLWKAAIRIAGRSCGCYSDILSVAPSGNVLPCPYLPESAALGNVRQQPLADIYRVLQKKQAGEYQPPERCGRCNYRHECGGGCFTYSYLKNSVFSSHCNGETEIGFCSYLLVDLYSDISATRL